MFTVQSTTEPTPGQHNEDYLITGPAWFVVLDGATAPTGIESGCIHDVPWLVRHLAGALACGLAIDTDVSLPDILAAAIGATCAAHADTCDLTNPASPSSTVAIVRHRGDQLEYLSLADSSVVFDLGVEVLHAVDDRTSHLADYSQAGVRAVRNTEGTPERPSFWVASTSIEAAYKAVTGSVRAANVRRFALLSDGASRWVDRFHLGKWSELLDVLSTHGPAELTRQIRTAELAETEEERAGRRGKRHDDVTTVFVVPNPTP